MGVQALTTPSQSTRTPGLADIVTAIIVGESWCTFHLYFRLVLNAAELWRRDTRVRRCLSDVVQHENVSAQRGLQLRCQLDGSKAPANGRHRRPDRHAGEVDGTSGQHLDTVWSHGEVWRNATNYTYHVSDIHVTSNTLTHTVVIYGTAISILCQTGLSRHL